MKNLPPHELLQALPLMQKLLERLSECTPSGQARFNEVVLYSLKLTLSEAGKIYRAVSEGMLNLLDRYFDMDKPDAARGLAIYKENSLVNEKLNDYWAGVQSLSGMRGMDFGDGLKPPPPEFLQEMENYARGTTSSGGPPVEGGAVAVPGAPAPRRRAGPRASTRGPIGAPTSVL